MDLNRTLKEAYQCPYKIGISAEKEPLEATPTKGEKPSTLNLHEEILKRVVAGQSGF